MAQTRDDDEGRSTEAVAVPWGSGERSLDEFDPDSFDVGSTLSGTDEKTASENDDPFDPFGHLTTGAELGGRYRLERIIGRGACGVVFEASHLVIGKRVAVKCLYPQLRNHPVQVERFFQEARIAAQVEHPHVIKVFDGGNERDTLFLAMELLSGETLADRLDRGPLEVFDAVELFLKILDGVAAVHDKGVVHRDLKPENVFLARADDGTEGVPKVLDFGVSKLKTPSGDKELTALGTVMGTPYYMAPEQMLNSKDVDARADVYSLGVMLYEAIAGELPYDGNTVADIFTAAKRGDWVSLDQRVAGVSTLLSRIVAKAMQVDRDARFGSVREMQRALAAMHAMETMDPASMNARTIEDERSPLADLPPDLMQAALSPSRPRPAVAYDEVTTPVPSPAPRPTHPDARATQQLTRPGPALGPGGLPLWAIAAMAALAFLAFASLAVAVVALLL